MLVTAIPTIDSDAAAIVSLATLKLETLGALPRAALATTPSFRVDASFAGSAEAILFLSSKSSFISWLCSCLVVYFRKSLL